MTAQVGDSIVIDGESHAIAGCPALPWHDGRLIKLSRQEVSQRFEESGYNSTACWRGYIATWSLSEGNLYFLESRGKYVFEGPTPLLAAWVTQELRIPQGDMLNYCHMGFGTTYEEDLIVSIRMGREISRRIIDNRGTALTSEENLRRAAEHLPSVDTVAPGLFGKTH